MFGMLSGSNCNRTWRRVYAGLCRHQHKKFGVRSVMFLSYEAMFLYLLGVDAGLLPKPPENAPGCCKLRTKFPEGAWLDEQAASFCAAFGLVLARVKLEDDVRDDNSWLARSLLLLHRKPFRAATRWFEEEVPGLSDQLTGFLQAHLELEQGRDPALEMAEYVRPTASAFAAVYAAFAEQIGADRELFHAFGSDVGATIIAADCALDWERDRAGGQFNPLPDRAAVKGAFLLAMQRLSRGLWRCEEALNGQAGFLVLNDLFAKISRRHGAFSFADFSMPAGSANRAKAGFCDCDCGISACLDPSCCGDCGCSGCGDSGCGGSGCGDGGSCCNDIFGCDPCSQQAPSSKSSCSFDSCANCFDCCDCGSDDDKKKRQAADDQADWIGIHGTTSTPLTPSGVVDVGGETFSARAVSGHISVGVEVIIVDQSEAGFVVRPV